MVTLAGLCAGLSSVRFALLGRWDIAVSLIIVATIIDGMDGRIARMLKSTSKFGAELDSLCDFLNFGVAPALVVYMWKTHDVRGLGWAMVLFFAVCCALRLARFNSEIDNKPADPWKERFFTGVPSPAGAGLALLPLMLSFEVGEGLHTNPFFLCVYEGVIGLLMASKIPTFSMKKMKIRHDQVLGIMLATGLLITFMVIEPWITLASCGGIYLLTLPFSAWKYRRLEGGELA